MHAHRQSFPAVGIVGQYFREIRMLRTYSRHWYDSQWEQIVSTAGKNCLHSCVSGQMMIMHFNLVSFIAIRHFQLIYRWHVENNIKYADIDVSSTSNKFNTFEKLQFSDKNRTLALEFCVCVCFFFLCSENIRIYLSVAFVFLHIEHWTWKTSNRIYCGIASMRIDIFDFNGEHCSWNAIYQMLWLMRIVPFSLFPNHI